MVWEAWIKEVWGYQKVRLKEFVQRGKLPTGATPYSPGQGVAAGTRKCLPC